MLKFAYIDIGELGWSLYLSAHLKWLKKNTNYSFVVVTLPDRKCLYKDSADLILEVPNNFYKKFKDEQNCFGLGQPFRKDLKEFFQAMLPSGYSIPDDFNFKRNRSFLTDRLIYKPYCYSKKLVGKKKILIFPRYRKQVPYNSRNLPKLFYVKLIEALCNKFHDYEIETIGLTSGSYTIKVNKDNYKNGIEEKVDLQNLIDGCQLAVGAIGSQSALPKLTLLQGVPTFIIGHDLARHTDKDNWLKTKTGFYRIAKTDYATINQEDCINKIISFVGSCI